MPSKVPREAPRLHLCNFIVSIGVGRVDAVQVDLSDSARMHPHSQLHVLEVPVESGDEQDAEESKRPFRQGADDVVEAVLKTKEHCFRNCSTRYALEREFYQLKWYVWVPNYKKCVLSKTDIVFESFF
ncbi:hypothetical protein CEXT_483821 [Caerostris extrusa]|uniref:Uncharacterized protein n=1 Tax=Caerostris extrusa TaxID=172846 RepID=A0AAV4S6P2_CAEEX|nr:hypothetical protein CEXT_483821 [Caerostris extrusa]